MRTKNAKAITKAESAHMAAVKALPCSVCDTPGPSEAHHIKQGFHFLTIPLCVDCHQGSFNGIHGEQRMWKVTKKTEIACLNETIRRVANGLV